MARQFGAGKIFNSQSKFGDVSPKVNCCILSLREIYATLLGDSLGKASLSLKLRL